MLNPELHYPVDPTKQSRQWRYVPLWNPIPELTARPTCIRNTHILTVSVIRNLREASLKFTERIE